MRSFPMQMPTFDGNLGQNNRMHVQINLILIATHLSLNYHATAGDAKNLARTCSVEIVCMDE